MQAIESAPYAARLGVEVVDANENAVKLRLPFKQENANPGDALHGGVAASMIDLGGLAVAQQTFGDEAGPLHTASIQVSYLAAAIGEPIIADATLLRRGKELAFVDIAVSTEEGKAIARGLSTVRGRFNADEAPGIDAIGDDGAADPGPMGPHLPDRVAFIGRLGLHVEHMADSHSRIAMPFIEDNANNAGGVHEGAILAHLDTTGAMAAWAETGPGAYKASTVGVHSHAVAAAPAEELVAYGRVTQRDNEIFWSDVEVATRNTNKVFARGTVLYRIVIPKEG